MSLVDAFAKEDRTEVKFSQFFALVKQAAQYETVMNAVNCDVPHRFIRETNGLLKDWGGRRVFCNPPYGRTSTGEWIRKCYEEAKKPGTVVVALIPARTDTRFFHDYIYHKAEIRFIKGRLKFGGCKDAAPFPSMVVIFGKEKEHEETEHAGSRGTGKEEA